MASAKKWLQQRNLLVKAFENLPNRVAQRKALAHIYLEENMIGELREHLKKSLSIDLLLEYDQALFQQNISDTALLYQEVIHHYLESYVGRPAAVKVRRSLQHLIDIGQGELAKQLVLFAKEKYGDRASLLKELKELMKSE